MQRKGNFLLMDISEFRDWLQSQSITRDINKLQVHHTWKPNYSTRKVKTGAALAIQDHFVCLEGMRNTHVNDNGWSAIGQNITIFEDGRVAISLDRDLNKTPAGITGVNTGALCIEIIGNFDKGGDTMTQAQRDAVVHLYACLCERLDLQPNVHTIIYHAWYAASGKYLGDYIPGKSSKTCPGTNFFNSGNSIAAAKINFIPLIAKELEKLRKGDDDDMELTKYQWGVLESNVKQLLNKNVISDKSWLEKVQKQTLTNSELNWLNNVIAMRLLK